MRRRSVRYGSHRAQTAELWLPEGVVAPPVVVLLHGGFWRQAYTKRLMHGLVKVVVAAGWAAYNVEYRRVGRGGTGGWPGTFEDVAGAIEHLDGLLDAGRRGVVVCGHSAGGHLALWAAGPRATSCGDPITPHVPVRAVISLAGISDLVQASRLDLGRGAVTSLMGGSPEEQPARYRAASPATRLPLGVPQYLVHGLEDATVPSFMSEDYASRAEASGDDAVFVPLPGASHLDMIRQRGEAARYVATLLGRLESDD